jgi:UDP-N-acetylglucosamine acyltransferase
MTISETAQIHPSAIVEAGAVIGDKVQIGAFSTIGPEVTLDDGVRIAAHVVVTGQTTIGAETQVYPFTALGTAPQDLKFKGEKTRLEIGKRVQIRENVTMNPGTEGGGGLTRVGDNCLFMVGTHVAHDCMVGSNVIAANNATLAGHVEVGDFVVLGGMCGVHQFVRIGPHAMIGGMTGVERDVIPYGSVIGNRAHLAGLNMVGMKRRGFDRPQIHALRAAYRAVFDDSEGALHERASAVVATLEEDGAAREMVDFILAGGSRRFCVPEH